MFYHGKNVGILFLEKEALYESNILLWKKVREASE